MKEVTLKKLKINENLSEETSCYSAELWLKNRKVANCSNRGHGGGDIIHWTKPEDKKEVEDVIQKNFPHIYEDAEKHNFVISLTELLIIDLINEFLVG